MRWNMAKPDRKLIHSGRSEMFVEKEMPKETSSVRGGTRMPGEKQTRCAAPTVLDFVFWVCFYIHFVPPGLNADTDGRGECGGTWRSRIGNLLAPVGAKCL